MKNKYKLLFFEEESHYGSDDDYKIILKDATDWIELDEEEVQAINLYLRKTFGYNYTKYVLVKDSTDELSRMLKEGIKIGKKLKEEADEKKELEKEKALKRKQTRIANQKRKEALELEKAMKLLKSKGVITETNSTL